MSVPDPRSTEKQQWLTGKNRSQTSCSSLLFSWSCAWVFWWGFHVFRDSLLTGPEIICLIKKYCEVIFLSKICLEQNVL